MPGVAITALTDDSDAVAVGSIGAVSLSRLTGFNGSTYDRIRTLGASSLDGLGQQTVSLAIPGSSVVKGHYVQPSASESRHTLITPTSGKRIRILSVTAIWLSTTFTDIYFYFDTGAAHTTDITKIIAALNVGQPEAARQSQTWTDGAGPVGAVNDVVSLKRESTATSGEYVVLYREE